MLVLTTLACAQGRPAAPAATMVSKPPPAPTEQESDDDLEKEWHTFRPAPMPWSGKNGSTALYPVARGYGCQRIGSAGDDAVFGCGRSAIRVGQRGASLEPFRAAKVRAHEQPSVVFELEGELWMDTRPWERRFPDGDKPWDEFFVYQGSTHRFHDGAWKSFPTIERAERSGAGWLVFDLPPFDKAVDRTAPGCADFACARALPRFWTTGPSGPDFAAFVGKLAWVHPYENEKDYAYVVDKDGPVHVLARVLDLATQRRVIGIFSWTPRDGARFDPLPALAGDAHFGVEVSHPKKGGFQFELTTFKLGPVVTPGTPPTHVGETRHVIAPRGSGWSVTKPPPPKPEKHDPWEGYEVPDDGPDIGGYRMSRARFLERKSADGGWEMLEDVPQAQLMRGKHGDIVMGVHFAAVYHSVQPLESFVLTDSWGDLHPWPDDATDDCARPFAVFDALDPETYAKIVETGRDQGRAAVGEWGLLPKGWTHLTPVVFRLFDPPLVVIGAPLASMQEAKALREQWSKRQLFDWGSVGLGGERNAASVVCARPVKPLPFEARF